MSYLERAKQAEARLRRRGDIPDRWPVPGRPWTLCLVCGWWGPRAGVLAHRLTDEHRRAAEVDL